MSFLLHSFKMYLFSFYLLLGVFITGRCDDQPVVKIPLGTIEGELDQSINGRSFYSFEGIPYAKPPVGKHRFKEPVPPKPWEGVWKANTKFQCLQYSHFPKSETDPVEGTEDCLYLNIYTPNTKANMDVLVYIHGGAFMFGSGAAYKPHILLDRDVVFVTINYRLGPLGFLSTEDDFVPGNNGLKDQIMALKWVKDNIQYFGGNTNKITVMGMSAGAASAHFHTLSTKSQGLFHRAISMSGCMLNPWVLMENPLQATKKLASLVGCQTGSTESMIHCLRKRPGTQIVGAVQYFQHWRYNPFSPFGIVVDSWASDPVLPKHPLQILKKGSVNDVPWMVSHTTGEGLYPATEFYSLENIAYIDQHWNEVMPHILHYNYTLERDLMDTVSGKIRKEYFGSELVTLGNFKKLVDTIGDRLFVVDLGKCSRLHAAAIKSPVFYYVFDYRGAHSWTDLKTGTTVNIGVSHADDTVYVLKTDVDTLSTEEDRNMSKFMVDSILSFAKYGTPKNGFEWPEVAKNIKDPIRYLKIASDISVEKSIEFGNPMFWDALPFRENEKLFPRKDEL